MEEQVQNKVSRIKYFCTFGVTCLFFSRMTVQAQISKPISIAIENTSSEPIGYCRSFCMIVLLSINIKFIYCYPHLYTKLLTKKLEISMNF